MVTLKTSFPSTVIACLYRRTLQQRGLVTYDTVHLSHSCYSLKTNLKTNFRLREICFPWYFLHTLNFVHTLKYFIFKAYSAYKCFSRP